MRFFKPQVEAPPLSRRRMRPPTPLQNSYSSFEEEQGNFEVEDQMWSAKDRTIIAKTKQYLEESKKLKVQIEELESLLGPDDTEVDFRRILEEARDEKSFAIFETISTDGPSEFLLVSRSQWDKRVSKSRELDGALEKKKKVWGAVENYLENCVHIKSGHRGLGALDGARKRRGLSKVHPEALDERRQ